MIVSPTYILVTIIKTFPKSAVVASIFYWWSVAGLGGKGGIATHYWWSVAGAGGKSGIATHYWWSVAGVGGKGGIATHYWWSVAGVGGKGGIATYHIGEVWLVQVVRVGSPPTIVFGHDCSQPQRWANCGRARGPMRPTTSVLVAMQAEETSTRLHQPLTLKHLGHVTQDIGNNLINQMWLSLV